MRDNDERRLSVQTKSDPEPRFPASTSQGQCPTLGFLVCIICGGWRLTSYVFLNCVSR